MSTLEEIPVEITNEINNEINIVDLENEELYNPIFSKIRIYGSKENPLFVEKDVRQILGLSDFNISKKKNYIESLHYVNIPVPTGTGGTRYMNALTEMGLYAAMFSSSVPLAIHYCNYIVIVMKQLRINGIVTIESSFDEYKNTVANIIQNKHNQIYTLTHEKNILEDVLSDIEDPFIVDYCKVLEKQFLKKEIKLYTEESDEDLHDGEILIRLGNRKLKDEIELTSAYMVDPNIQLKQSEFCMDISDFEISSGLQSIKIDDKKCNSKDKNVKNTKKKSVGYVYGTIYDVKKLIRKSNFALLSSNFHKKE